MTVDSDLDVMDSQRLFGPAIQSALVELPTTTSERVIDESIRPQFALGSDFANESVSSSASSSPFARRFEGITGQTSSPSAPASNSNLAHEASVIQSGVARSGTALVTAAIRLGPARPRVTYTQGTKRLQWYIIRGAPGDESTL